MCRRVGGLIIDTLTHEPFRRAPPRSLAHSFTLARFVLLKVYAEFTLIANTSALTFMVAGTFKEVVTIGAAVVFLGEAFTPINGLGLFTLICGVSLYNYFKYQKYKEELLKQSQIELMSQYDYSDDRAPKLDSATETTGLLSPLGPERSHSIGSTTVASPRHVNLRELESARIYPIKG
jgi:hypothetical protein